MTTFKLAWEHKTEDVFLQLARSLEGAPDRMGARLSVEATRKGSPHPNTIRLLGQLRGSEDEVAHHPRPRVRRLGPGRVDRADYSLLGGSEIP